MNNILDRVQLEVDENGIAWVDLNRPSKLNALDLAMFKALDKTLKIIKKDKNIRVVILRGKGDDFCTGLDIQSVMSKPKTAMQLLFKWLPGNANLAQRVSTKWRTLSVPVIAAIHGRCWGGGMQIALGADFRIISPNASVSIMESRWGLIPDMGGNKPLADILPLDQAMKIAMTGEQISAARALELGLVTEIAPDLNQRCVQLANTFINRSPDVLSSIKRLYIKNRHRSERTMLSAETRLQVRILSSPNQKRAVAKAKGKAVDFKQRKVL